MLKRNVQFFLYIHVVYTQNTFPHFGSQNCMIESRRSTCTLPVLKSNVRKKMKTILGRIILMAKLYRQSVQLRSCIAAIAYLTTILAVFYFTEVTWRLSSFTGGGRPQMPRRTLVQARA
jgi:hypothetical protein